jgi:hypothetical protein
MSLESLMIDVLSVEGVMMSMSCRIRLSVADRKDRRPRSL